MPAQPDKAMMILANAVAEVVGANSRAFQQILVAAGSDERRDFIQARSTFDGLPGSQRRAVKGKADRTATPLRQMSVFPRALPTPLPRLPTNPQSNLPPSQHSLST